MDAGATIYGFHRVRLTNDKDLGRPLAAASYLDEILAWRE